MVTDTGIYRVKQRVSPDTFQVFDLYMQHEMPVMEVARLLGTNVAKVYLAKHRVAKLLRETIAQLERADSGF